MQESHADIAQIMGLETATITNRISILKKELNEKFRQDSV
jgi:DNA-directed RNA polymerase specialized sigma24 family protein